MFKYSVLEEEMPYTGKELRPHFIFEKTGNFGNAFLCFAGECVVPIESMVDIEDRMTNSPIYSKKMLNILAEFFDSDLNSAVLRQRLFIAIIIDELRRAAPSYASKIRRSGDDIFVDDRKLSVSIATNSPTSTLLHIGLNINAEGAPVKAIGLNELGITNWKSFTNSCMHSIIEELKDLWFARCKVISR